jgi:hypothetical protein
MQISFRDFDFEGDTFPLFYRTESLDDPFLYQQWQYELNLLDNKIFRFQSLEALSNRPFKLSLTLWPNRLEVKFAYFIHSYVLLSEETSATPALLEEAYDGTVYQKGPFELWSQTDEVSLSESVVARFVNEPYNGLPYEWELKLLLAEKTRRQRLLDEETILLEDYPFVSLNVYRPLTPAALKALPDRVVYGVTVETKSVEKLAIEVVDKLMIDYSFGFTSSHGLSSYTLDYMPDFTLSTNLKTELYNQIKNSLTIKDFTNASLD